MSKSVRIPMADYTRLMRWVADVASFKSDPFAQRQFLINSLAQMLDAESSMAYVVRDWTRRPGALPRFVSVTLSEHAGEAFEIYARTVLSDGNLVGNDPFCTTSIDYEGPSYFKTRGDVLNDVETYRRHERMVEWAGFVNWSDGMVTLTPAGKSNPNAPVDKSFSTGFALHRLCNRRRFTRREIELGRLAGQELGLLAQRGHLLVPDASGEAAPAASPPQLPPRLEQVLNGLIAGRSPKEIAAAMGLSVHTVRDHIKRLYAINGVRGRSQLMARHLRGGE